MPTTPTTFSGLVNFILGFINILIPALFGIVFLYLLIRIIDAWVIHADDDSKREEGRRMMITAVIVFVLMISAWGIVALIKNSIFG
jgi:membrane-associated protease RseP (regulator of RpoE activity)